ncbi:coiled-coil domain-containing protein 117 [Bufo gargarizans]|uniref:coiled-coil domain-containing protein 117 n=1 Tax=Bufo gargarizans TaxID=30331 RepID=UPI001CF4D476|nr:coiled-coil domain-containing protein 117 [Bufo gargarizans]XP_044131771.1 coiled-coil domain-containing protein 117 [Bufo gargarizans]
MAVVDRAFSAAPFYRMEYHQTLHPFLQRTNASGIQPGQSRKHRLEEENSDCPMKKRRFSPTPAAFQDSRAPGVFAGGPRQPLWTSSHSQVNESAVPTVVDQSPTTMPPVPTEEMEDVVVESHSDAVLRRIRDLESRLVVEDEDEEDGNSRDSYLPTLVMSDVLVEGFKKRLDESLTRKIVDSMSRPSMELVLWKPQPEFLVHKLERIASSYEGDKEASKEIQSTPAAALLQEITLAEEPCPSNVDPMWNRDEEEMEL